VTDAVVDLGERAVALRVGDAEHEAASVLLVDVVHAQFDAHFATVLLLCRLDYCVPAVGQLKFSEGLGILADFGYFCVLPPERNAGRY